MALLSAPAHPITWSLQRSFGKEPSASLRKKSYAHGMALYLRLGLDGLPLIPISLKLHFFVLRMRAVLSSLAFDLIKSRPSHRAFSVFCKELKRLLVERICSSADSCENRGLWLGQIIAGQRVKQGCWEDN